MPEINCVLQGKNHKLSYVKTFAKDYVLYNTILHHSSNETYLIFKFFDKRGIEIVPVDTPDHIRQAIIEALKNNGEVL